MTSNLIQTFQLDVSNLRGRILRLDSAIDDILTRHGYPDPVLHLTGEATVLALLLSSMLKYDGIFTLQTSGDGPVSMLVADVADKGTVRACARFRPEEIPADVPNPKTLMGTGYLAFTVDQGPDTEQYQGIVALPGESLQECVQHYFTQSEQITTGLRMAISRGADGKWRAGAIMLQRLPEQAKDVGEGTQDDWRRAMILLQSCTDEELIDFTMSQNDLLFRLFHEEEVRVYDPEPIHEGCRCSPERAADIIAMLSPEERVEMTVDSVMQV
ncbi:MAG: Hsp33-like chaperonin, partial [Micavibrio sp.]|nr:Hsp33-like chaperonin [Micavibrio sp.]